MYSWVERTGIDLGDPSSVKHVRAVWPKLTTSGTGTVKVSTGFQMNPDQPVTWDSVVPMLSDSHVSPIRYRSNTVSPNFTRVPNVFSIPICKVSPFTGLVGSTFIGAKFLVVALTTPARTSKTFPRYMG